MSKKIVYDNSLIYDNNRIGQINGQIKKSSLYSDYIWTNGLHSIELTPLPSQRSEFKFIINELDKHKEKDSKGRAKNYRSPLNLSGAFYCGSSCYGQCRLVQT